MRHFFQHLFKTPMFLILVIISVVYGFPALGKSAEISRFAIVTAVGIDQVEEEDESGKYEISLLTFIPIAEQNFTETYKVISAKGRSVSEAMDLAGLNIGREIGLSHVKTVVLNQDLLSQDVSKFLDYLSRSKYLAASTKLIATDVSAKDFLSAVQQLDSESSIKVSELVNYNSNYIYSEDSSFELFFKGFFGPTRVSTIPFLTICEDCEEGLSVANTSSQESGSSGGGGDSSTCGGGKDIENQGETILFKDGKMVAHLTGLDMKKINLIRGNFNTGSIEVENFSDGIFQDVNLIFEIFDKKIDYKVVYENGIPVMLIDIKLTLSLSEVDSKKGMVKENLEFFVMNDYATKCIEQTVRDRASSGLEIMRDHQADIPDFYTIMHNSNKTAFKKFLSSLEDKDNYLSEMVFKVGVTVYSK